MNNGFRRVRYLSLTLTAGGLLAFGGCGLSDQQLTSIWQSILQTGLNTVISNIITAALSAASTGAA